MIGNALLLGTVGLGCMTALGYAKRDCACARKKANSYESFTLIQNNNPFNINTYFGMADNLNNTVQYERSFRLRSLDGKYVGSCIRCRYANCRNPLCLKDVADETCIFVFKECKGVSGYASIQNIDGLLWSFCKNCIHNCDEQICVDGSLKCVVNNQFKIIANPLNNMQVNIMASNQRLVALCPGVCHADNMTMGDRKCGKLFCSPESTQKINTFNIEYL